MTRRGLLRAALALAGAAIAVAAAWVWRRPREAAPGEEAGQAGRVPADLFPAADVPVLLAVADVIVPRVGSSPAASEIGVFSRLALWVRSSPSRSALYASAGPRFAGAVRSAALDEAQHLDPGRLHALCEAWYREYRTALRPSPAAAFFEQLRRDVLRAYYASPAGWAFVGFEGPAKSLPAPEEARR